MISAGVEGRLAYMTYSEPWSRNPPKHQPEVFLRPAPKLLPPAARCTEEQPLPLFLPYRSYNGVSAGGGTLAAAGNGGVPVTATFPNGTRIAPSRPIGKYPSPPPTALPVNLAQPKEEREDPLSPYSPYRIFPHSPQYSPFPYPALCQQPPYMLRTPSFPPTPVSPQETFSPGTPTASSTSNTFMSPPATFSPPSTIVKHHSPLVREKRTPPTPQSPSFKVPSGKEGSMKHRLLTRPEDAIARNGPLDLQKPPAEGRKRLGATMSPPRSPKRALNNNAAPGNFQKGQMIQLANGEFKRIEEMRTEDFIQSAEKSPALRLAESTVLKIEEGREGHVTVTLAYNQRRAQVEVDSTPEHPYFVMGHGWASFNPDRTLQCYGLKVHRLQVGDVLVSLTPRDTPPTPNSTSASSRGTTIMTTATTTTMSARPYPVVNHNNTPTSNSVSTINHGGNLFSPPSSSLAISLSSNHHRPLSHSPPKPVRSPEYILSTPVGQALHFYNSAIATDAKGLPQTVPLQLDAESRKRRWSAPDAIEEEEMAQRSRMSVFDGSIKKE
ncbi:proteoglycan 4 isoform X1 [Sitophilus oryzae]|uniref:Proteoglycan 4 isoform X1 n=1 Tax=Sitophilus oryzae TaxID=7048 RepID=A0A6J2YRE9_SITOR|nr:proteoglycan 4 isoform X1 [Sitophilus oryzae]